MKTGAKNGLYLRTLETKFKGQPPTTTKRMLENNPREYGRRVMMRALHRRIHDAPRLKKFGRWVKSIRKRLGKSQSEFGKMVGVSVITVRRWELALGHSPATYRKKNKHGKEIPSNMERLTKLAELCKDLKKSGTPFEEA